MNLRFDWALPLVNHSLLEFLAHWRARPHRCLPVKQSARAGQLRKQTLLTLLGFNKKEVSVRACMHLCVCSYTCAQTADCYGWRSLHVNVIKSPIGCCSFCHVQFLNLISHHLNLQQLDLHLPFVINSPLTSDFHSRAGSTFYLWNIVLVGPLSSVPNFRRSLTFQLLLSIILHAIHVAVVAKMCPPLYKRRTHVALSLNYVALRIYPQNHQHVAYTTCIQQIILMYRTHWGLLTIVAVNNPSWFKTYKWTQSSRDRTTWPFQEKSVDMLTSCCFTVIFILQTIPAFL